MKTISMIAYRFHEPAIQRWLMESGSRCQIIQWLVWNDGNGVYEDEDSQAEGYAPLTVESARDAMKRVLAENMEGSRPRLRPGLLELFLRSCGLASVASASRAI